MVLRGVVPGDPRAGILTELIEGPELRDKLERFRRCSDRLKPVHRRVLYVMSFNFTHPDIDHSRGFAIVTKKKKLVSV